MSKRRIILVPSGVGVTIALIQYMDCNTRNRGERLKCLPRVDRRLALLKPPVLLRDITQARSPTAQYKLIWPRQAHPLRSKNWYHPGSLTHCAVQIEWYDPGRLNPLYSVELELKTLKGTVSRDFRGLPLWQPAMIADRSAIARSTFNTCAVASCRKTNAFILPV